MADIELVIKIPEEIYIHSLSRYKYQGANDIGLSEFDKVGVAIKNSIPLPKGHGRLIDADKLPLNAIDDANYGSNYIRIAPTIIEADKGE